MATPVQSLAQVADVVDARVQAAASDHPPLIVRDALEAFLDAHGLGSGPIAVERIGEGHSNINFLVRRGTERMVLRRPPRPPFARSAHDVLREARVLTALEHTAVRSPAVLATCDDRSVLGVPFYLMGHIEGHTLGASLPDALDSPDERQRVGLELVDALAELHAVAWPSLGLERFGRPSGYLERQLRRFGELWRHNRTREVPGMDALIDWLGAHLPESPPATLVHGDYRLGNVMFAPSAPARLAAVLDWEMATIGDPLADLGYLCATYAQPDDPPNPMCDLCSVTREGGFPTREALVAHYEERTGRALGDLRWYRALALWKAAVFLEGSYGRFLAGTTDDPFFRDLGEGVPQLVDAASRLTGESGINRRERG